MDRRKFIRLTALGSASTFLVNGHVANAFNQTAAINGIPPEIIDGRSIVLVQLRGGNDGLNTIIPLNQYDTYANLRPKIKQSITAGDPNKAIELDSTLALEDQVYLHPAFTDFKDLYDQGKLNIIHGVGYPVVNKSHFASRALMFKGGDGTPENSNKDDGWMARYLHAHYDLNDYQDPLGIQLGSKKPSLGFYSGHEHKVDVNLAGQDISGYYSVISNLGNPAPTSIPTSDFGDNISFISGVENNANGYSQRISEVFDAGSNAATYPDTDLASQLKTVARMIKGGSKTKIYLVTLDGFDNHANQIANQSDPHLGQHAELLKTLGQSVKAFQTDLEAMGLDEQVVTASFTEFGRKPKENGNLGTDHGNLGPMFVIGSAVKGGMTGTNLDLTNVTKHYDENNMQNDYRQAFSTLLTDFLGASTASIEGTEFEPYDGANKLDLINTDQKVTLGVQEHTPKVEISVYPNPIADYCNVQFTSANMFRGSIIVHDLQGKQLLKVPQNFMPGLNRNQLNLGHLSTGLYLLTIKDEANKSLNSFKIIKR